MYLNFAWRYFKAKKSANAINIIAWVTAGVIAFATCCQILVLSVFNGFEDLVKSMYSSFYSDIKIIPSTGKTFIISNFQSGELKKINGVEAVSFIAEEKALLQNGAAQSVIQLKGVDSNFYKVSGLPHKITEGVYNIGDAEYPKAILGIGVQYAAGINLDPALNLDKTTVILPKSNVKSNDPLESLSEGVIAPAGIFTIQQEFDNSYAITNIDFVKQQMGIEENRFSSIELKLNSDANENKIHLSIQKLLGKNYIVQTRYEQNASLYRTMKLEKWIIYAVLTLILIIAAFNMISALTMLVLEKKQDISILQSMGASNHQIKKIFLSEGILLGVIGSLIGISLALIVCMLQMKYKIIKLQGGSFLIDYFPVKLLITDFLLVAATAMLITIMASWLPAQKASRQPILLR